MLTQVNYNYLELYMFCLQKKNRFDKKREKSETLVFRDEEKSQIITVSSRTQL